jgi:hypothetical protein
VVVRRRVGGGVLGPVALHIVPGGSASGRASITCVARMPAGTPGIEVLMQFPFGIIVL